jgi:hypothetical protein
MTHASGPEEIKTIQKAHDEAKAAKARARENPKGASTKGILHQFI